MGSVRVRVRCGRSGSGSRLGASLGAALLVVMSLWAGESSAADACITKEARKALTCSGPKLDKPAAKRKPVRFKAPKAKPKAPPKPNDPSDVKSQVPRIDRKLKKLGRKFLLREIANVSKLYQSTPKRSRDKPRLLRRLADNYAELESALYREQIEAEIEAGELRRRDRTRAAKLRAKAKKIAERVARARKQAIRSYRRLASKHPG